MRRPELLVIGATCCLAQTLPAFAAFEQSVNCLAQGATAPAPTTYQPWVIAGITYQDHVSRYVAIGVDFGSASRSSLLRSSGFGTEFKFHHYNYDDAGATGKGPAYVLGPGGYAYCDLPGCYLDSDVLSELNGANEYREPIVGFGMMPGNAAGLVSNVVRVGFTRAVSGRGNRSLLKVSQRVTRVAIPGAGVAGVFLCADIPTYKVVTFQEGVYSPICFIRQQNLQTGAVQPLSQFYSC